MAWLFDMVGSPAHTAVCIVLRFRTGPGQPVTNWRGTDSKDLQRSVLILEEAEALSLYRHECCRGVWTNTSTSKRAESR